MVKLRVLRGWYRVLLSFPPVASSGKAITVAIIDDNRLVREALAAMLERLADVSVVTSATADSTFLAKTKPDVLLLDLGLGDQETLNVALAVRRDSPQSRIIVMDVIPVHDEIIELVNAGVSGFVLKDSTFDEFVETIRSVAAGQKVLPARMTDSLFAQIAKVASGGDVERALEEVRMTARESEVILLIGEGLSNKEIAQRLAIAPHTVKSHVRNVMEKLSLHTRLQIAAYSRR